jgi:hypothetical protein
VLELTALTLIVILYIIPLNIPLYRLSERTMQAVLRTEETVGHSASLFYTFYTILLFAAIYMIIKYIMLQELDIQGSCDARLKDILSRHKHGQKYINITSNIVIFLSLLLHVLFMVFDIKLLIMGMLCITFVFRDIKHNDMGSLISNMKKKKSKRVI